MARSVIGLDIGSSAVRAVELGSRGRVRKAAATPLPEGAVEAGTIKDADALSGALKRLWHEGHFSSRNVRLGVGTGSVLVRQVEVEWMAEADLRKALSYLVADLLPVPVDEANIDHITLGDVEREDPEHPGRKRRMLRLLLVATAREGVDEAVRCVRGAGLRAVSADLSAFALIRAAERTKPAGATPGAAEAVLDIGVDKVSVAVHTDGLATFVRVIPGVGGATLTRHLAAVRGLSAIEADTIKRSGAVLEAGPSQEPSLVQAAGEVIHEVAETLRFYSDSSAAAPLHRIVLAGAGGLVPGFGDMLAGSLNTPVQALAPPPVPKQRRKAESSVAPSDYAVGYGLALEAKR